MIAVLKIIFFGLCYPTLMRKTDPNREGGGEETFLWGIQISKWYFPFWKEWHQRETPISNHVTYLFECKQCQYRFPYVGSTKTKFMYRINNYKSTHRKFTEKYDEKDLAIVINKSELKQKLFHEHYCSEGHQGIENWSVALID